jgi:catechol 2,3-dioxygenase-like lactoylglutathione lyase family enzyme
MIQTKGVVHFTIPVSDLQRSESFYYDILGLEVVSRVPTAGMVFMKTGNDYLVLGKSDTPINPNSGDQIHAGHG